MLAALWVTFTGCRGNREKLFTPESLIAYGDGPVLAVSRTHRNRLTLIGLEKDGEREIGTIALACKGPFGLAFGNPKNWLYTACWDQSRIALIDLKSAEPANIFAAPRLAAWIQSREGKNEVWVSNEGTGTVTIYRSGTTQAVQTIRVGAGPSDIAFSDEGRKAWISNETAGTVSLVNAETYQKIRDIPVGKVPQGMAVTRAKDRLLVANFGSDNLSVINTAEGRSEGSISVCQGPIDLATTQEGDDELAFVSCFKSGSVGVVDVRQRRQIQTITVGKNPFGVAAHPGKGRIYVCVSGSDLLAVIRTEQPRGVIRRIPLDGDPLQIAVRP